MQPKQECRDRKKHGPPNPSNCEKKFLAEAVTGLVTMRALRCVRFRRHQDQSERTLVSAHKAQVETKRDCLSS